MKYKCPRWMPAPLKDYEYTVEGHNLYMNRKPKLKHIIYYWPFYEIRPKIKAKRVVDRFLKELK